MASLRRGVWLPLAMAVLLLLLSAPSSTQARVLGLGRWRKLIGLPSRSVTTSLTIQGYAHVRFAGDNGTEVTVASLGAAGSIGFGNVLVADDPFRQSDQASSSLVGRIKGIGSSTDITGAGNNTSLFLTFLIDYKGVQGSLQVQGTSIRSNQVREFTIVGGTGAFRLVSGLASQQTVAQGPDPADSSATLQTNQWNLTLYDNPFANRGSDLYQLSLKLADLVVSSS